MQVLTFRAARSNLGIPIEEVREIIDSWSFTPLPLLPEAFAGVANLRGEAVPVADLTRIVGGVSESPRRTMIVLRSASPLALLIDAVVTVVNVDGIEPATGSPGWIAGTAGDISIIDAQRLWSDPAIGS